MKFTGLLIRNSVLCALALFMAGCASVDYVGDSYAPTDHVDMYYSSQDIHRPYRVMGQMTIEEEDFTSAESMQADLRKEAMSRGADAVLFTGLQKVQTGVVTDWQDTGTHKGKHQFDSGTSTTHIEQKKQITGSLLKYTDLQPSQPANT